MKIIVIEPNKPPEIRDITGSYEEVAKIIDGYLECIPLMANADAFVDENAKFRSDRESVPNPLATTIVKTLLALSGRNLMPGDFIARNMVIIGNRNERDNLDGEWHDVPREVITYVSAIVDNIGG